MVKLKMDVVSALKSKGYSAKRLREEGIMAEGVLTKLRHGKADISCKTIGAICSMLRCQPGDIIENIITDEEKIKYF